MIIAGTAKCSRSAALLLQKALRIQGRHAPRPGTGDGLAVNVILNVACSKYARHAGLRRKTLEAALGANVAAIHIKLALEELRIG